MNELRQLPFAISINGCGDDNRHPGNANVCFHGFSAHEILNILQPNIAASTGAACSSGIFTPSHVLRAIGLSGEDADASIRFSFGATTHDEEIDVAVFLIGRALDRLAGTGSDF